MDDLQFVDGGPAGIWIPYRCCVAEKGVNECFIGSDIGLFLLAPGSSCKGLQDGESLLSLLLYCFYVLMKVEMWVKCDAQNLVGVRSSGSSSPSKGMRG